MVFKRCFITLTKSDSLTIQSEIPENCNMIDAKQSSMFSPRNLE